MTDSLDPSGDVASLRRHSLVAFAAIGVLVGGLGVWASTTQIAGAVVAGGTIVVDTYSKLVQHQDGGIVKSIFVRNEETVVGGQLLIELDDTTIQASIAVLQDQLSEALAQEARLTAELGGTPFVIPSELEGRSDDSSLRIVSVQQDILANDNADRDGKVEQLREQIRQLEHDIEGLQMQLDATQREIAILAERSEALDSLYASKLVGGDEVSELRLQMAAQEGESGRLVSAIARTRATIAEKTLQVDEVTTSFRTQALDQLQKVRQAISELRQSLVASSDKLRRTEIRSPQDGVVHETIVHTVGGVVAAGQTLMEIVPQSDELFAQIHVDPMDVDQLKVDQDVTVHLSGLEQRTAPEITANVVSISPDLVIDQTSARSYYTVRLRLDETSLRDLPEGSRLLPGMPVQAFALTGNRTVFDYLLLPMAEQLRLAMRQ